MLAIIIPYYKLTFFEATLQSLALQTNKNFKVYIGNDASPENPERLLEFFKDKFDFEYIKFDTNLGSISLVKQWKRCFEMAKNESWTMILGDDDVLTENVVEAFYDNLQKIKTNNIKVVRFATQIITTNSDNTTDIFYHREIESTNEFFYKKHKGLTRNSLSEHIFDTNMLKKHFFYDFPLAWHSDDLAILECSNFDTIFTINKAILFIRISDLSISGNQNLKNEKSKATQFYFERLANLYLNKFNKINQGIILSNIEYFYFRNHNFKKYLEISTLQLKYFGLIGFLKYNRRIYLNRKQI